MDHQDTVEHIQGMGKVLGGGVATYGATYGTVSHLTIEQATQWASLIAAIATALYFTVSALYALWKWRKEANGTTKP